MQAGKAEGQDHRILGINRMLAAEVVTCSFGAHAPNRSCLSRRSRYLVHALMATVRGRQLQAIVALLGCSVVRCSRKRRSSSQVSANSTEIVSRGRNLPN